MGSIVNEILIGDAYPENGFRLFRLICRSNNLCTIDDLKDYDFDNLINIRSFGIKKVSEIKNRYDEILEIGTVAVEKNSDDNRLNHQETERIRKPGIEGAFYENKFTLFRAYCKYNGKESLESLEEFDFGELRNERGFGAKRIQDIIDKYSQIINMTKDEIIDRPKYIEEKQILKLQINDVFKGVPLENVFSSHVLRFFIDGKLQ